MAASAAALAAGLRPALSDAGVDLEDVTVQRAGRREIVRVVVDRDGGVDLDTVAHVSQLVASLLDAEPLSTQFAGAYVLEVTSPGVDRPLTEAKHWRRAVQRLVHAHLAGGDVVVGRIVSASDTAVVLSLESGEQRELALGDVTHGEVQIEFNRPSGDTAATADADDAGDEPEQE